MDAQAIATAKNFLSHSFILGSLFFLPSLLNYNVPYSL